jgi:hypothetical protein
MLSSCMQVLSGPPPSFFHDFFTGKILSLVQASKLFRRTPMAVKMSPSFLFTLALVSIWPCTYASIGPITDTLTAAALPAQVNISQALNDPLPYYFPDENAAETPALFPMPPCHGVTLEEATIDQLQQYMSQGILSSVKISLCYLERVWQTNDYIKSVDFHNFSYFPFPDSLCLPDCILAFICL